MPPAPAAERRHEAPVATLLRWSWWLGAFVLAWVLMLWHVHLLPYGHRHVGGDFTIYWVAGEHLRQGRDAYAPVVGPLGFVYPPFALAPFALLSLLPLVSAYVVWLGVCAACLTSVVALAVRRGLSPWLGLALLVIMLQGGYVAHSTWLGQIGVPLFALVCCDVVGVRSRRWGGFLTGIAIGIKFTPAVFLLIPCVRRQWRWIANAALAFVGTLLVGIVMSPSQARHYWDQLLVHHRLGTGVPTWFGSANNQGLTNALMMLMGSTDHAHLRACRLLAMALGLVVVLAGVRAAALHRAWLAVGLLGVASCLVTTSTWDHHYVWFCALLMALACGELRRSGAAAVVLVAWTLWSLTARWERLIHVPLARLGTGQLLQATATPLFAVLFAAVCLLELRHDRRPGEPGRRRVARLAEFGAVGQNRRVDHEGE